MLEPKDLIGKTIKTITHRTQCNEDITTLHFTDGSIAIFSANVIESPSSHWGDSARLSIEVRQELSLQDWAEIYSRDLIRPNDCPYSEDQLKIEYDSILENEYTRRIIRYVNNT